MGATMKKYKPIIFIMVLVMVFSLAGMSSSAFASDLKPDRESLKNLKGVYVNVQDVMRALEQEGLSKDQIRTDIELKLRAAGIKVLTHKEHHNEKGAPFLHVYLNTISTKQGAFIYSIFFGMLEEVSLVRNNIIIDAITWSMSGMGYGYIEGIRAQINKRVDEFINAYLSVNPKI
jgi:ABC-type maltose transport system permease subunit